MHAARMTPTASQDRKKKPAVKRKKQAHLTPAVIHHARVLSKAIDEVVLGKQNTGNDRNKNDKPCSTTAARRETRIAGIEFPS